MTTMNAVTFAKLPTGEITVVLNVTAAKRSVSVGTRRPEKSVATKKAKFKTIRMFADSLVFQAGFVRADGTGCKDDVDPSWYDPWVCNGNNWESFDKYYKDWEDEEEKEKDPLCELRSWRDSTDTYLGYGKFVKVEGNRIVVKRFSGDAPGLKIEIAQLCEADRKLIETSSAG